MCEEGGEGSERVRGERLGVRCLCGERLVYSGRKGERREGRRVGCEQCGKWIKVEDGWNIRGKSVREWRKKYLENS